MQITTASHNPEARNRSRWGRHCKYISPSSRSSSGSAASGIERMLNYFSYKYIIMKIASLV
jgi:hypothetical protein